LPADLFLDSIMKKRCDWVGNDPLMISYHDKEWGVPLHDDGKLFEFLILEGAQAGLSWSTVLKKRDNYRKAFDSFNIQKIAKYDNTKINLLLHDSGIIRNKLKIAATIQNAKAFLFIQKEFNSFDKYVWQFVDNKQINHSLKSLKDYPTRTKEAEEMSKDLLKRGFKFVGPTICYAFMQAVGLVNDHQQQCFRYKEVQLK
jgi:DNA-3-methyladenine glycosylase I